MIQKISVENNSGINSKIAQQHKEGTQQNPNFQGLGAVALAGIQACERMPMVNVAVIDMLSAILPRTIVESMTNWFAGFEAFRRESSGLVVNCLIPSLITLGLAKLLNPIFMPKGINMSRAWADREFLDKTAEYYKKASSSDKIEESLKSLLNDMQGIEGKNKIIFKEALGEDAVNSYAKQLAEISKQDISNSKMREEVKKIAKEIINKTHVSENITIDKIKGSNVASALEDSVKFHREFARTKGKMSVEEFAKRAKGLVKTKSLMGLAVILPLAISMQYINRWITGKLSGTKGAPIYDDFGKGKENIEQNPDANNGLLKQKIISISSMIGVALLSMMKTPSFKMLEFKGMFPTMDQARIISTSTFASRMAAADDKNELREATVRDIATFSSLYFLGDYAAKAAATFIQNKYGVTLLNESKTVDPNASVIKKFWHWVKDVHLKSSDEVVSKTQKALNGLKPTKAQAKAIEKEIKHAINLRSACQYTNIGVSLALLGLVIPIFTRRNTKKKHEQALKLAQQNEKTAEKQNSKEKEAITPLDVKYSSLTAGFRADNK